MGFVIQRRKGFRGLGSQAPGDNPLGPGDLLKCGDDGVSGRPEEHPPPPAQHHIGMRPLAVAALTLAHSAAAQAEAIADAETIGLTGRIGATVGWFRREKRT